MGNLDEVLKMFASAWSNPAIETSYGVNQLMIDLCLHLCLCSSSFQINKYIYVCIYVYVCMYLENYISHRLAWTIILDPYIKFLLYFKDSMDFFFNLGDRNIEQDSQNFYPLILLKCLQCSHPSTWVIIWQGAQYLSYHLLPSKVHSSRKPKSGAEPDQALVLRYGLQASFMAS